VDELRAAPLAAVAGRDPLYIADGHHRYETALAYRNAMRMKNPSHDGHEAYNFVPMFFCNMHDPGMVVLPTHRLLGGVAGFDAASLLGKIGIYFSISEHPVFNSMMESLDRARGPAVGMAMKPGGAFHLAVLGPEGARLLEGLPEVIRRLDVTVLHDLILGRLLGLSADVQEKKTNLEYERDPGEALRLLGKGNRQAAFFMRAMPLEDVRIVAEAGLTLPQKSTYFYPKLLSGLVNYVFDGEDRW